jgi:hypothetical protein
MVSVTIPGVKHNQKVLPQVHVPLQADVGGGDGGPGINSAAVAWAAGTDAVVFVVIKSADLSMLALSSKVRAGLATATGLKVELFNLNEPCTLPLVVIKALFSVYF